MRAAERNDSLGKRVGKEVKGIRGLDCECGRHLNAADPEFLFESTWTGTTPRMSSATSRSAA
jgi:hypothetical protein